MAVAFNSKTKEQQRLGKFDVQKATISGVSKVYFALKPGYNTHVTINKGASPSTGTLKFTSDYTKGGNVDDAVFGDAVNTGTDNYQKGSTPGFTGVEVDITTSADDVIVRVAQFLIGD